MRTGQWPPYKQQSLMCWCDNSYNNYYYCVIYVCSVIYRQLAGSRWLEKKFIEQLLTEQISDDDVTLLLMLLHLSFTVILCFWRCLLIYGRASVYWMYQGTFCECFAASRMDAYQNYSCWPSLQSCCTYSVEWSASISHFSKCLQYI